MCELIEPVCGFRSLEWWLVQSCSGVGEGSHSWCLNLGLEGPGQCACCQACQSECVVLEERAIVKVAVKMVAAGSGNRKRARRLSHASWSTASSHHRLLLPVCFRAGVSLAAHSNDGPGTGVYFPWFIFSPSVEVWAVFLFAGSFS